MGVKALRSIVRFVGLDEAVRVANDTEDGLSSVVLRCEIIRALAVTKRIESCIRHPNGPTMADKARMPFGGMKGSGCGCSGGKAAITAFTKLRWITIEALQHYPS